MRVLLAATGAAVAYVKVVRPWHIRWGATDTEVQGPMPGDHLLEGAEASSTRAVDVHAPPEAVWPWLVQLGWHRAGFYAPRRLEQALDLEAAVESDRVQPSLQGLEVGDRVALGPERLSLVAHSVVEPSAIVLEREDDRFTSAWAIRPTVGGTRVLVRDRWSADRAALPRRVLRWALEPLTFAVERSALRGIKARAESAVERSEPPDPLHSVASAPVVTTAPGSGVTDGGVA